MLPVGELTASDITALGADRVSIALLLDLCDRGCEDEEWLLVRVVADALTARSGPVDALLVDQVVVLIDARNYDLAHAAWRRARRCPPIAPTDLLRRAHAALLTALDAMHHSN